MDSWQFNRATGEVIAPDPAAPEGGRLVADVLDPADGPLIALAPRMLAWMRALRERPLGPEDYKRLFRQAQAIFRELEAAEGGPDGRR